MKKILLTLIFSCFFIATSFAKESLTILNAGSKTGSFAMQMTAVSKDLQKYYDIDLKIPGDYCTAVQMLKSIKGPVMMPWANDYEAIGRDGKGCATFEVTPSQVIRFDSTVMCICSMKYDKDSIMKNKHKVGHSGPALPFRRAVLALGESFGAKVTPIAYDGSGATKTGLYNGEVDYVMISKKHALDIIKNGGKCFYEYSANTDSNFVALATLDPNNLRLIAGYDAVWLAINMSDYQIKKLRRVVKRVHMDPGSAMYEYTQGGKSLNVRWNMSDEQMTTQWETSVKNLQE